MNNEPINAQMVVLARESRGFLQSELANLVGVTQAYISRIEGGISSNISSEVLGKLSSALDFPPEFFFQADKIYGAGSSCNYYRKRQTLKRKEWLSITATLNIVRLSMGKLLRGVDVAATTEFPFIESDDCGGPEVVAQKLRTYWGIPHGPIPNITALIESAGGLVYRAPFVTDKLDAISQRHPAEPPLFIVNANIPGDRLRFTLAHEIGHLVMHDTVPSAHIESEADRFASEFLMPATDIAHDLGDFTLEKGAAIKPYWKVSIAALIERAFSLKKISAARRASLYKRMNYLKIRREEPVAIPPEIPTVIDDVISAYRNDMRISVNELSRIVSLCESDFRDRYLGGAPTLKIAN